MTMKKADVPVRVRRYRSEGHHMETRVFAREIHETFCAEPSCKFYGKRAAQGVCHARPTDKSLRALKLYARHSEELQADTRQLTKGWSRKRYIEHLESQVFCNWMNYWFTLDELVRLRAENAQLRLAAKKYK